MKFLWLWTLAGGIAMGLTVAPVNAWLLAWIALAPLWVAVRREKPQRAWRYGALWGLGFYGISLAWIAGVHPLTWMGVPWLASLATAAFCWAFVTLWGVALSTVWAVAIAALGRRLESPILIWLWGVALWCALEALWSRTPLWWTSLAFSQSPYNLAILHLGQLSGAAAVTAAIAAVNGCWAQGFLRRGGRAYLAGGMAILLAGHGLGGWLYSRPLADAPEAAIEVGLIQGNVPNEIKLYPEGYRQALEGYASGYETLAQQGVDAILTPEVALPIYWERVARVPAASPAGHLYQSIQREGVPIWLGAFGRKDSGYANSLFFLPGTTESEGDRYDKVKLVPLGEYIPFERVLGGIVARLSPLEGRLLPGSPRQTFESPWGVAIASICYESAFSYHFRRQAARGGAFILSSSNDDHYAPSMPAQHHAQDVMRAIEVDRWAARATNTGYSAIVDARGRTLWRSQLDTYELHRARIYARRTRTPYVRWGDWLTPTLVVAAIAASGAQFARRRL